MKRIWVLVLIMIATVGVASLFPKFARGYEHFYTDACSADNGQILAFNSDGKTLGDVSNYCTGCTIGPDMTAAPNTSVTGKKLYPMKLSCACSQKDSTGKQVCVPNVAGEVAFKPLKIVKNGANYTFASA